MEARLIAAARITLIGGARFEGELTVFGCSPACARFNGECGGLHLQLQSKRRSDGLFGDTRIYWISRVAKAEALHV